MTSGKNGKTKYLKKAAIIIAAALLVAAAAAAGALVNLRIRTDMIRDGAPGIRENAKYSAPVSVDGVEAVTQEISCGYAVIEMFSAWNGGSLTEEDLYGEYGRVVTSTGGAFCREMNKRFPEYATTMNRYMTDTELIGAVYDCLADGIPVPVEWAALYGDVWTLHYSLVTGMDIPNDKITVANPYGYYEEIGVDEFLDRTAFEAYEDMPLWLETAFAFGIFEKNTVFTVSRRPSSAGTDKTDREESDMRTDSGRTSAAGRIFRMIGAALCSVLLAGMLAVGAGRTVNYAANRITDANGVDESIFVDLCGQEQRILVRGRDVSNPVVIWLHGGPSGPDCYANYVFQKYLVDRYTFINWDQRGCGSTYYRNRKTDPDNSTATFGQALADLDALVNYARGRFGTEKVIIAGHSYGTMLGSRYIALHPEKVAAYVGTGQVVCVDEIASYEHALAAAKEKGGGTSAMTAAFEAYSNERSYDNIAALRKETKKYNTAERERNVITFGLFSPHMNTDDLRWFLLPTVKGEKKYVELNGRLVDEMLGFDIREQPAEYAVPVNYISGSDDWTCPAADAKAYSESVTAPFVSWNELEGCGHRPQLDAPEEYAGIFDAAIKASLEKQS